MKLEDKLPFLALFASAGTLLCCALPALLVSLGFGAALAALVGLFPGLVWFSENKAVVFTTAALLLFLSAFSQYLARSRACPVEARTAQTCARARKVSKRVFLASMLIFGVGCFFAFVAPQFA